MVNSSYFIIAIANNFDILQLKKDDAYFLRRVGLSNRLTAAILKDFRLENMECSKYQLIFVTAEEVLSKPILFCLKIKKKMFHRFTHRLYVCLFLSDDNASEF